MKLFRYIFSLIMLSVCLSGASQESAAEEGPIRIPPLFEYISAPDTIADITGRSNYVITHFWDPMDFSQNAVGQIALNHAFGVYATPMRWADKEVIDQSVKALLKKLASNPTLLLQFTKAAEYHLYSENASVWIDDYYIPFLRAITTNKKLDDNRKAKYARQFAILESCKIGDKFKGFDFEKPNGDKASFAISAPLTLIEFGNPSCNDCRMAKLRLQTNSLIEQLVDDNKLVIYFIVPDAEAEEGWDVELASYPYKWKCGAGNALDDIFDIRNSPTLYLLDEKGTILEKNQPIEKIIDTIVNINNKDDNK